MIITIILTIIIVNVLLIHFGNKHNNSKVYNQEKTNEVKTEEKEIEPEKNYSGIYKQKWLLSYNEKDQFKKIKEITDKYELYIFTKVRLFDLIILNRNIKNYKEYMWRMVPSRFMRKLICRSRENEISRQQRRPPGQPPDASCSCTFYCPTGCRPHSAGGHRPA
ncbi:hypothetical protein [Yanshouia hominis]|uniref:Uncharacterized protein n=1 Tax=Yanshouia hominis TaxID=2763673 RepID=A0ABR7NNA1_9FIRM|nr:hypothetical protein [Yanshouia hominis]MBC8577886.1 hypothetical protein [Yanshouia hominis]